MLINKEETIKSFKCWINTTVKEQECTDDEVIDIIHEYIIDSIAENNLC